MNTSRIFMSCRTWNFWFYSTTCRRWDGMASYLRQSGLTRSGTSIPDDSVKLWLKAQQRATNHQRKRRYHGARTYSIWIVGGRIWSAIAHLIGHAWPHGQTRRTQRSTIERTRRTAQIDVAVAFARLLQRGENGHLAVKLTLITKADGRVAVNR